MTANDKGRGRRRTLKKNVLIQYAAFAKDCFASPFLDANGNALGIHGLNAAALKDNKPFGGLPALRLNHNLAFLALAP